MLNCWKPTRLSICIQVEHALDYIHLLTFYSETSDIVEIEGVRRAVNRSQEADLLIIMLSITELQLNIDLQTEITNKVSQLLDQHLQVCFDCCFNCLIVQSIQCICL